MRFFFWISWVFAIVDAIAFLSMDNDEFNVKYNKRYYKAQRREKTREQRYDQRRERDRRRTSMEQRQRRPGETQRNRPSPPARPRHNPYKPSGIRKFREFDYTGAIKDFEKALEISPNDVAVHFNLACAYSLTEKAEESFYHLGLKR